jgi:glycosyltransferase involved in cell wall biosynthesis
MPSRNPRVSVCVPTFNRAELVKQSIESVLRQSFEDFELIVSDNASTDGTEQVVRSFGDERIVYVRNPQNVGILRNWNRCLAHSKGEFITFLPDDDLMMPENVAAKVTVLASDQNLGMVHSKYHIIDRQGQIIKHNTNYGPERSCDAVDTREDILLGMYCPMNAPTVMFRSACYARLGEFVDHPGIGLAFDYEYWMRIALYYKVAFLASPLIKWRVHEQTLTNVHLGYDQTPLLRQTLAAKHYILKKYARSIPRDLREHVRREACSTVVGHAYSMLGAGGPNPRMRRFILDAFSAFPRTLVDLRVWKVFLKSTLSRRNLDRLERASAALRSARLQHLWK